MKKLLLSLALTLTVILGYSQGSMFVEFKKLSYADTFAHQTGVLIKQEYNDLVEINKCKVCFVSLTNVETNKNINALRFEFILCNTYVYVDEDEIETLLKLTKYIQSTVWCTL